jgi:hypothetical protein
MKSFGIAVEAAPKITHRERDKQQQVAILATDQEELRLDRNLRDSTAGRGLHPKGLITGSSQKALQAPDFPQAITGLGYRLG